MATIYRSILTYLTIFTVEGMDEICCHYSVFLIRPTPTHDSSLQVNLKISISEFADPTLGCVTIYINFKGRGYSLVMNVTMLK